MKLSKVIQSTLIGVLASLTLGFTYAHANESDSDTMVMYYHHDVRGDPVVVTDSSGSILWLENYRAYGASEPRVSSAGIGFGDNAAAESNNRLGYTGHERDGGSGLTYMKARYYDNLTGRFLSNDPVGYTTENPTQSFNRYMYVNNNPYTYVDPDGEFFDTLFDIGTTAYEGGQLLGTAAAYLTGLATGNDTLASMGLQDLGSEAADFGVAFGGLLAPGVPSALLLGAKNANRLPASEQTFEIIDGVKRAKSADIVGNKTVRVNIVDANDNLIGSKIVPVDALRSPNKPHINTGEPVEADRFFNSLDLAREGSVPPNILVTPGARGPTVRDITIGPE